MRTDVIISGGHNDLPHLKEYSDKSKHEASIKSFKLASAAKKKASMATWASDRQEHAA